MPREERRSTWPPVTTLLGSHEETNKEPILVSFKQGSTLGIRYLKLEVGQVIPDTYLSEGQVIFLLEKVSNISLLIKKVVPWAVTLNIHAGKF